MRYFLYQLIIHLLSPFIFWLSWRKCTKAAKQQPKLQNCFAQKLGDFFAQKYPLPPSAYQGGIVIHAVSLGETRSVLPLIERLQQTYPDLPITLTNGSVRGAKQIVDFLPEGIHHSFLPLDYPFAVKRFLKQLQPKLLLVIETEIWPNFFLACEQQNIPLVLTNARLKRSSMLSYQKWGGSLITNALNACDSIACQFPIDQQHFLELGVKSEKLSTIGNLKFDIDPMTQLQKEGGVKIVDFWASHILFQTNSTEKRRFCWVAASTHEKEELLMLQAHQQLLKSEPDALLILVPRQADRFDEVAELCQEGTFARRSLEQTVTADTQVYLADSVGEMMIWFSVADVAFIGGSLVNFGGHNILEPAALSKPVVSGKWHHNLQALYDNFKEQNAIRIVDDESELAAQLIHYAQNPDTGKRDGEIAYQAFQKNRGALDKLYGLIQQKLD